MKDKKSIKVQRKEKNTGKKKENGKRTPQKCALIVTTVSGFVPQFEMNNVRILKELGYKVHYASNFRMPAYGEDNARLEGTKIICHQVDFERSPYKIFAAIKAYQQMKELFRRYDFSLLHCHTPMGGVVARLAAATAKRCEKRIDERVQDGKGNNACRVIYTAHGFHFFKGAPFLNWLLYYPAERLLAHVTDVLITVNKEDYDRAKKFHLRKQGQYSKKREKGKKQTLKRQIFLVNGVGIDVEKYRGNKDLRKAKRRELLVMEDEFMLLSVGELTRRKNHQVVVRALAKLREKGSGKKVKYFIAGKGAEHERLEKRIKRDGLERQVVLLGYRADIGELLAAADCFVFPSRQEGMPVALMEAIAAGVPCIAADIRGCRELLKKEELVKKNRTGEYCGAILKAYKNKIEKEEATDKMAQIGTVIEKISGHRIKKQMEKIYRLVINET